MKRLVVSVLVATVLVSAVGPSARAQTAAPQTVKVATIGIMGDIGLFAAMERGYFAERGLKLDLVPIAGAGDVMAMLATNQLDFVGGAFTIALFNAIARGLPIRAIVPRSVLVAGHDSDMIVVRADLAGSIKSARDLKGRKFALSSPTTSAIQVLGRLVEPEGLSHKDVDLVAIPFPNQATAFSTKAIDVAYSVEPFITQMQERGLAVRWKGVSSIIPGMQVSGYLVNHEWADRNPRLVQGFVTAYLRGVRDYYDALTTGKHREEIVNILIKHTRVKDRPLYDRVTWNFIDPNGHISTKNLEEQIDWYVKHGLVTQRVPADKVVDLRYVEAALKELGTVPCPKCSR
jgi:NitT/TauT family transport system substrate-binding protein